jgi:hypothetical protein
MSLILVEELECLKKLSAAWEIFLKLKNKNPMDNSAFCSKINELQYMIAARVARRDDKEVWAQFEGEV